MAACFAGLGAVTDVKFSAGFKRGRGAAAVAVAPVRVMRNSVPNQRTAVWQLRRLMLALCQCWRRKHCQSKHRPNQFLIQRIHMNLRFAVALGALPKEDSCTAQ